MIFQLEIKWKELMKVHRSKSGPDLIRVWIREYHVWSLAWPISELRFCLEQFSVAVNLGWLADSDRVSGQSQSSLSKMLTSVLKLGKLTESYPRKRILLGGLKVDSGRECKKCLQSNRSFWNMVSMVKFLVSYRLSDSFCLKPYLKNTNLYKKNSK